MSEVEKLRESYGKNGATPLVDQNGVLIGQVRLCIDGSHCSISLLWVPEFVVSMPDFVCKALVEHLRLHADRFESGEQAARLAAFLDPKSGKQA
jgi:hypothetical protein